MVVTAERRSAVEPPFKQFETGHPQAEQALKALRSDCEARLLARRAADLGRDGIGEQAEYLMPARRLAPNQDASPTIGRVHFGHESGLAGRRRHHSPISL